MARRKHNRAQREARRIAVELKHRRWQHGLDTNNAALTADAVRECLARSARTGKATAKRSANRQPIKDECLAIAAELGPDCKADAIVATIQARLGDRAPARRTILDYISVRDREIPH